MKAGDKYQACVDALAAYAKGIGFSQVVIGLSGGIDSSVTAVMAVDAFGAKNVHGELLPGPYSTGHSIDDASPWRKTSASRVIRCRYASRLRHSSRSFALLKKLEVWLPRTRRHAAAW